MCGAGRAVSVVIGVAGSGKTTALDTVTTLLDRPATGCWAPRPAAKPPAPSAPKRTSTPPPSRRCCGDSTTATITLDARTVVVVDETGMADDANLARLALAVQHAHAVARARR